MDKKELLEKIKQLIDSKDAANNFLALNLLHSQLGLSFIEAFTQLKMVPSYKAVPFGMSQYSIPILDYSILFLISHQWNEDFKYPYLVIRRTIKHQKKELNAYQKIFSINFFESENERDMYEAMIDLPNLGEGLEPLFF